MRVSDFDYVESERVVRVQRRCCVVFCARACCVVWSACKCSGGKCVVFGCVRCECCERGVGCVCLLRVVECVQMLRPCKRKCVWVCMNPVVSRSCECVFVGD